VLLTTWFWKRCQAVCEIFPADQERVVNGPPFSPPQYRTVSDVLMKFENLYKDTIPTYLLVFSEFWIVRELFLNFEFVFSESEEKYRHLEYFGYFAIMCHLGTIAVPVTHTDQLTDFFHNSVSRVGGIATMLFQFRYCVMINRCRSNFSRKSLSNTTNKLFGFQTVKKFFFFFSLLFIVYSFVFFIAFMMVTTIPRGVNVKNMLEWFGMGCLFATWVNLSILSCLAIM